MTMITYVDSALQAAVSVSATQTDECSLIAAAFASNVTVKLYGSGTHRATCTLGAFSVASTTPRSMSHGSVAAYTLVAAGAVDEARYFDGSTERFRCPITIGDVKAGCTPLFTGYPVLQANSTKPVSAGGLTGADLTLLGRFVLPATAGTKSYNFVNGGFALKTGGATPQFFVGSESPSSGNSYIMGAALIEAPAVLASPSETVLANVPAATVVQYTNDLLDGAASRIFNTNASFNSSNGLICRGMVYDSASNKLGVAIVPFYGSAPSSEYDGCFFKRSGDLTATSTTVGPAKLATGHPRQQPGGLTAIPPALQTAWSCGPWAAGGSSGLSTMDTAMVGPGLIAFDPAGITGAGVTVTDKALSFYTWASGDSKTLSEAVGSAYQAQGFNVHVNFNSYWGWTAHTRGGPQFIDHRSVVIHAGMRGTTRDFYDGDGDPANYAWSGALPNPAVDITNPSGNGPRSHPYQRCLWVYNYSELAQVAAGTKAPHQAVPASVIPLSALPFQLQTVSGSPTALTAGVDTIGYTIVGSAYDSSTKKLYLLHGGAGSLYLNNGTAIVDVYQVAT